MKQFIFKKGCRELRPFPHIIEFALKKITTIELNSLKKNATKTLRIFYIVDGKYHWVIDGHLFVLYPGDLAIILPGQALAGETDFLEVGTLAWLHIRDIRPRKSCNNKIAANWSSLLQKESKEIAKTLLLNNVPVLPKSMKAFVLFQHIQLELLNREIGYRTRINQLIDELLVFITRSLKRQNHLQRDFPQTFVKLEHTLNENLSHQWTVEEMASLAGLGTTAFSEKIKSYTGFSPLNYLINKRITEATNLLKRLNVHVTDIALDTGFYSSQHFATTFKKLTGYTPREFRRNACK